MIFIGACIWVLWWALLWFMLTEPDDFKPRVTISVDIESYGSLSLTGPVEPYYGFYRRAFERTARLRKG